MIKLNQKIEAIIRELNPTYLFYITYILILVIWIIPSYVKGQVISFILGSTLLLTSILFFHKLTSFLFNKDNILTIIIQSFDGKPEKAIDYLISESENWLNDVSKFIDIIQLDMKRDVEISNKEIIYRYYLHLFCSLRFDKRLKGKILSKESDLQRVFNRISEFIGAERDAIEKLVGVRADIDPRIVREMINDYESIKKDSNMPERDRKLNNINRMGDRFKDKLIQLRKLKKLESNVISEIINEIRVASTGKAVTISSNVLQKAENVDELKWLIKFVNSRSGFKIAELLGLELEKKKSGKEWVVKWDNKRVVEISGFKDYNKLFGIGDGPAEALFANFKNISQIKKAEKKNPNFHDIPDKIFNQAINMVDFNDVIEFLKNFKDIRDNALNDLWNKFSEWCWDDIERDVFNPNASQPLSITLTYGYSSILEFILDKIIERANRRDLDINMMQLLLIENKQKPGDEKFLRAELIGKYPQIKISIMPVDALQERGLQIGKVFVGIESIDISGDIVHPRGSVGVIKNIKTYAPSASFYAVCETYKVKYFKKIFIDYTKLAFFKHGDINYVVTDHGIHKLNKKLLFDWNDIPKKDIQQLQASLKESFNIDWMDNANIEQNDKTIYISTNNNKNQIVLGEDRKTATLITSGRSYNLIVKEENGKLNIYKGDWELRDKNGTWKPIECLIFSLEKIPGKDDGKLKEFLIYNYGVNWIKEVNIDRDEYNKISISDGRNYLSIKLITDTKAKLEISDGRSDEFIVKKENNEQNIYDPVVHSLCCCRNYWENTIEHNLQRNKLM